LPATCLAIISGSTRNGRPGIALARANVTASRPAKATAAAISPEAT
jgi:hypothetical protein